jgi:hypothetical protein
MLSVVMQFGQTVCAEGTAYYVSQSGGDDTWDGLAGSRDSAHGPWKTLAKASTITYQSGDSLLLQCGDCWNETLTLRGSAPAANPITLASYGEGERPSIERELGNQNVCVLIDKGSGYCIRDLRLGQAQNAIRINIVSTDNPAPDGYLIENCLFAGTSNPLFPDISKKEGYAHNDLRNMGYAVFINGFDSPQPVRLTNLTVRHCVALRTQGFFIQMGPITLEHVLFDGNTIAHSSYNSVYQAGTKDFDIVNNVFAYAYPWEFHPSGATQVIAGGVEGDATVRNEVKNNEFGWSGDYPGCPDGCGYDFEGACNGVTFQNNFVHDTFGESVLFMGNTNHNDLLFDGNLFRDNVRFSPRWDVEVTLFPNNTGTGTFSNNIFFPRPGKRAFNSKPSCFTFENNQENAEGTFAKMPLVTKIEWGEGQRTYTLTSATPGADIRYTLDGSLPTVASLLYSKPLALTRSGGLNAKAFQEGCYPSYVNALMVDLRDAEGQSPAAWWKLDETKGDTVADSSGNSSGVLQGAAWTADQSGNSLTFDGEDDLVLLETGALQTIADTFTIVCWAYPAAERAALPESNEGVAGTANQRYALYPTFMDPLGEVGTGVSIGTNGITIFEHGDNYLPPVLTMDTPLQGWNHVTVVYRDKQPTLYLNGVYQKAGYKSTKTVRPAFGLGGPNYGSYKGKLADICVYARPLTDAEIQALAKNEIRAAGF